MKNTEDNIIQFRKPYQKQLQKNQDINKISNNASLFLNIFLFVTASIFITWALAFFAYLDRGYFAIGGEYIFLLLIPIGLCKILGTKQKKQKSKKILEFKIKDYRYYKIS